MTTEESKLARLQWMADVYSYDPIAITDETANLHLFDRLNDFGMDHFLKSFRPLNKLREQRGELKFHVTAVTHPDPDITYAHLCEVGSAEPIFVLRVRFEEELPCRVRYWFSYPPLPDGVLLRPYTATDAAGCVALEQLCPIESADGTRWTLDRGEHFDDYLQLMAPVDAWVAEFEGEVIGFFSTTLRAIRFNDEPCFSVYQHHYRVHPDHRSGSVSQALASHVDARRTFDGLPVVFPYSLIDPDNLHMRGMGFPPVEDVRIARMSLSIEQLAASAGTTPVLAKPGVEKICELMGHTHGERVLYPGMTAEFLAERWQKIATFGHDNYRGTGDAFVGLWVPDELNILERDGERHERRLGFVLDYGTRTAADLLAVLAAVAGELAAAPTTHLCVLCDSRAEEYALLQPFAEDEASMAFHTLPWITQPLQDNTIYCDGAYC